MAIVKLKDEIQSLYGFTRSYSYLALLCNYMFIAHDFNVDYKEISFMTNPIIRRSLFENYIMGRHFWRELRPPSYFGYLKRTTI